MKIKKGDTVKIIAGKDRGKTGVVKVALRESQRLVVEGINIQKRHHKPTAQDDRKGIIEVEGPIHVSNAMLLDPKTNKSTKVGYQIVDNKKVRIAKKSKTVLK